MRGAVEVHEGCLAWLNKDRNSYAPIVGRTGAHLIVSGRQRQLNRAFIESVYVIDNLARIFAIFRLNSVTAMVPGRTLVDKVAPGGINYEVTIGIGMREGLGSRTDRLNDGWLIVRGAGGQED